MTPEHELVRLKNSARILLASDVYDALARIADEGCNVAAVLRGPKCRPGVDSRVCPSCTANHLMNRMRDKLVRASWNLQTGAEMIANERERQVEEEEYLPGHDDEHTDGEIAMAAACYAVGDLDEIFTAEKAGRGYIFEDPWPWGSDSDKRGHHNRIPELVKAGALCAAEIDRLKRKEARDIMAAAELQQEGT